VPTRGRKLAALLTLVAASAAFALWWRSRPPVVPVVPPIPEVARVTGRGRPVLFVGLDGADWDLLDRYVAAGAMPNLGRLVQEGTGGTLMSLHPPLSPLVWTTMMTGVSPLQHGILDFTRRNPADGREEPITSDERRVPAVWNMATYGGKRVAVLGLWATYPAETVNGLMVTDRVFPFLFRAADEAVPGLVHPPSRFPWVREVLRRAEEAVGLAELRVYLPSLSEEELRGHAIASDPYAHPVSALRRILIETRLVHGLLREWMREQKPDLAVVYLQGTDSVGHVFAPFAPPRQPTIREDDFARYSPVPERYFRYVDGLLGEYRRLAEARGAVLFLASDHGFRWTEGRPARLSSIAGGSAAAWHRQEGMYVLWGPGVVSAPGHPGRGGVEQVTATLLALLDLPPAGESVPLAGVAASARAPLDYAAFYRPAASVAASGAFSEEALEKLRALGYVGGATESPARHDGSTRTAGSFANACLMLRLQGRAKEAAESGEKALSLDAHQATALWCLGDLLQSDPRQGARSDDLLVRAYAGALPQGISYVAARADAYRRAGDSGRALKLVTAAVAARPEDPEIWRLRGRLRVDRGDCVAAKTDFEEALRRGPADRGALASLGLARLCLGDEVGAREALAQAEVSLGEARRTLAAAALSRGDLDQAEREAVRALAEPAEGPAAALLLAETFLRRNQPERALDALAKAPPPSGPLANHAFLRGDALARLGRAAEAEAAFREEIRAFPANSLAYTRLAFVLGLARRDRGELRGLMTAMYDANPRRETAALAARTLLSIGDREGARTWQGRAAAPAAGTSQ